MSTFKFIPYTNNLHLEWDSIVSISKNGNFLHLRNYLDYHISRFDEQSIIVYKNSKPVAVFPCNRIGEEIISHGGLTYAGLIYSNLLHTIDVLCIFDGITSYYTKLGCKSITYKAIPHIFHRYPAEEDLYALFRIGARLVRRDISSVVRLNYRTKLSDSRKNTIRKAKNHGLFIREEMILEDFYILLIDSLSNHGIQPVHTLTELQLLKNRFPDQIRLFGSFNGSEIWAGALIYDFGEVVHTQYLTSSIEGRKFGALDYLLDYLLDIEFSSRQYFSFGISTLQQGYYLNEGLIFQKEGFGGRGIVYDFYEWKF